MLERLVGGNTDIVVAGDSMMRQFYLRLVQQLRGRKVLALSPGPCLLHPSILMIYVLLTSGDP